MGRRTYCVFYEVVRFCGMNEFDEDRYSVLPFFQYYMADVVKTADPEFWASILIAVLVSTSIPAAMVGGRLSDKFGRKPMVYISSGLLASGMILMVMLTFVPSVQSMMAVGVVMGAGYGAYQAVDWALALDVLPPGANIAKDMGIWHVAVVFPQVISPLVTGVILNAIKEHSITTAYIVVCLVTAMWFILATVFIYPVKRAKPAATHHTTLTEDDL